jgi:hypothetical protein
MGESKPYRAESQVYDLIAEARMYDGRDYKAMAEDMSRLLSLITEAMARVHTTDPIEDLYELLVESHWQSKELEDLTTEEERAEWRRWNS